MVRVLTYADHVYACSSCTQRHTCSSNKLVHNHFCPVNQVSTVEAILPGTVYVDHFKER